MKGWLLGLGVLAATVALTALLGGLDWGGILGVLRGVQVPWLLAAVLADGTILVLWALQWVRLLPPEQRIPLRRMLKITSVMAFTVNTAPLMTGQAVGTGLLARWGRVGGGKALSVLAMDQLAEGTAKIAVLGGALLLAPLPAEARGGLAVLVSLVALLGLLLVLGGSQAGGRWLGRQVAAWSGRSRFVDTVAHWTEGLAPLRSPLRWLPVVALALGMKGAELGAIVLVQHAVGTVLPVGAALVVLSASMLATMLPVTPGNLGTYEAAVVAAYTFLGVPAETAVTLALLQHVCLLIPMLGAGYGVLLREGGRSLLQARDLASPEDSAGMDSPASR